MKTGSKVWILLIAFAVGVVAGAIFKPTSDAAGAALVLFRVLDPLGKLFVRMLQMLVVPLVFSTLAVGVSETGGVKLGRMFLKTMFFYYSTAVCSVIIGLVLANALRLGQAAKLGTLAAQKMEKAPPLAQVFLELVPTNPVKALAEANMLQIIVFAIFFGVAMGLAGKASELVRKGLEAIAETMYKVVEVVLYYAPIGVFCLMTVAVGRFGLEILKQYAWLIIAVYVGCALQMFVVYGAYLYGFCRINPLKYLGRIKESPLFAFSTCSSSATLPVTMRVVQATGVSRTTAGFVLPMGATVNMDGTALYQAVCAVFLANAFGTPLTVPQQVTVGITAILASIGTAGVPGAGLIMLGMVLSAVNVPLEGIAFILGVDRILDMARTAVNVTDDAVAAALVAGLEGETLAEDLYVGRRRKK